MSVKSVTVTRSRHGPFERIVLSVGRGERQAMLSVYRMGELLVDAGGTRVAAALVEALRPDPPRRIVLTHQHEDHAGGAAALRRAFGHIPVHAPERHVGLLAAPPPLPAYRAAHWGEPEPIPDAIPYSDGEVFEAGGAACEAVATPGHTPGHMALVAEQAGAHFALTGDLYLMDRPATGWYESDALAIARSCRALAALAGVCMLPTHGPVRRDGAVPLGRLADWLERTAQSVQAAAERLGTRDPATIARELLGEERSFARVSGGEFSRAGLVRSVLDPARALPAAPVRLA